MKKLPFAKTGKQPACLVSPGDFKKYRRLLLTGVVVMQLDKLIVASAKAYAIIRKANHDFELPQLNLKLRFLTV